MNFLRTFFRIRKEVRQRATKTSLFLLLMAVGFFLEAYMHNFNLVYIALFFLLASALAAAPLAVLNVGQLQGSCKGCDRLFANRPGECRYTIRNESHTSAWGVDLVCGNVRRALEPLPPGATLTILLPVTPPRRGEWSPEACHLESRFPLGTVCVEKLLEHRCRALVYPEPRGRPLEALLREMPSRAGYESDFDGLESYTGMQSPSRIHWPSVAKGETMAKRFEHKEERNSLFFDFQSAGTDVEARLSQLTLWVLACEKKGLDFTLRLPEQELTSRKEGIDAILTALARY